MPADKQALVLWQVIREALLKLGLGVANCSVYLLGVVGQILTVLVSGVPITILAVRDLLPAAVNTNFPSRYGW